MVYVFVAVGETGVLPDGPEAVKPVPEHDVALVLLQVSVEELPETMDVGEAVREAVGALPPIVIVCEKVLFGSDAVVVGLSDS